MVKEFKIFEETYKPELVFENEKYKLYAWETTGYDLGRDENYIKSHIPEYTLDPLMEYAIEEKEK